MARQDRPFVCSIAAAPEDAERDGYLELLVGQASGAGGVFRPGMTLDVEGPVGDFTLAHVPPDDRLLFVAGGTGIAPLRSMLRHALSRHHREIRLLYCARTPADLAYYRELRGLALDGRMSWRPKVTREAGDEWTGPRGRIARADLADAIGSGRAHCFVCGPPPMVAETRTQLIACGVGADRIRAERPACVIR